MNGGCDPWMRVGGTRGANGGQSCVEVGDRRSVEQVETTGARGGDILFEKATWSIDCRSQAEEAGREKEGR